MPSTVTSPVSRPSRRELLQIGFSAALGIGLPGLLAGQTRAGATAGDRARSVLFIFLTGGPSHVDTFDMKPDAPVEYRGEFRPIATRLPGVRICEHLPRLAARMDRFALVRSMRSMPGLVGHHHATQALLTGIDRLPPGITNSASRHDWPCYAAGLDACRPRSGVIPSGVLLPQPAFDSTLGVYSGQNAGFLGGKHDPWFLAGDPNKPDYNGEPCLAMPPGMTVEGLRSRQALLKAFDRQRKRYETLDRQNPLAAHQEKAVRIITSGRLASALDLAREPDRVRESYGRHLYGQTLLLARRLLQAGVPLVQANLAEYSVQWDTHYKNCETLKRLLPPLDRAVAALLDDMGASGLLEETLVILMGEFGRTPKIGGFVTMPGEAFTGRDHWLDCFSAVFAGGGVRAGQVIGASDRLGEQPKTKAYFPSDVGATVYTALGVDPATEVEDGLGRRVRLNTGERIEALFR